MMVRGMLQRGEMLGRKRNENERAIKITKQCPQKDECMNDKKSKQVTHESGEGGGGTEAESFDVETPLNKV